VINYLIIEIIAIVQMMSQINKLKLLISEMSEEQIKTPLEKGELIPYEAPASLPTCKLMQMNPKISFLVLPSDNDRVIIWNKFSPNAQLNYHYHNCWEHSRVLEGSIIYHEREYIKGEVIIIKPFLRHKIKAGGKGGVLIVELLKPK